MPQPALQAALAPCRLAVIAKPFPAACGPLPHVCPALLPGMALSLRLALAVPFTGKEPADVLEARCDFSRPLLA